MITDIIDNEYNLRTNIKNIKGFNYLGFSDELWEKIGIKFTRRLPKGFEKTPTRLEFEATKINPIVKMYFSSKEDENEYRCIKLTPFEVMVADSNGAQFEYNRRITREWQRILQKVFGECYEQAKNQHYGIQTL